MAIQSAGILCYRFRAQQLEVFLVHPGGPFWTHRDNGAWSIPKGIIEPDESALEAAIREFREETGFEIGDEFIGLGQLRQPSRKVVHAWAVQADFDPAALVSNEFELEWPRGSGRLQCFPEIDRGAWFPLLQARLKIYKGQMIFLDRLHSILGSPPPGG